MGKRCGQRLLGPEQRGPVPFAGERWLKVRQIDSIGEDPLGRRTTKLVEALTGKSGNGETVARPPGQIGLGSNQQGRTLPGDRTFVLANRASGLHA
jgi:hypothetical protein